MTYSDVHHWLDMNNTPARSESFDDNMDNAFDTMIACAQSEIAQFDIHDLTIALAHHFDVFSSDLLKEYDEWCSINNRN